MPPHPCTSCGRPVPRGQRCRTCTTRLYGSKWQQTSRNDINRHPWCAWCGNTADLTTDHIIEGDPRWRQTLCQSCNTAKRNGRQQAPHSATRCQQAGCNANPT
jgi:hypothetical protein